MAAVRGVPLAVWCITALHFTLLLTYSVLQPTYRSPDEFQHVDLAHAVSDDRHYPAWDERQLSPGVYESMTIVRWQEESAHNRAEDAVPKSERPSIEDLEADPIASPPNPIAQHPPAWYFAAGGAERVVEVFIGDPSYDLEAWVYRLVSILMVGPLPLVIWRAGRHLRLPPVVGIAATMVPLAIPEFTHIGSAANNDNLMLLMFALLAPVVIRIAGGALHPRTAALAGAITGIALFTKGFAMVLPLWGLAAIAVAWRRGGREARGPALTATVVYGLTSLVFGGWWWIKNLVVYQAINPSQVDAWIVEPENFDVDMNAFVRAWGYRTTQRFWGDFAGSGAHMPAIAFGLATLVVLVGMASGCRRRDRVAGIGLGERLLLAAPLLLLIATQFAFAFRGYIKTASFPGMQGRYLFGAVASMSLIVVIGLANLMRRRDWRWLPPAMLLAVIDMHVFAITSVLRYFWEPPGTPLGDRVRAAVAWAPLPGELLAVGFGIGVLVLITTVAVVAYGTVRPPGPGSGDGDSEGDDAEDRPEEQGSDASRLVFVP